MARDSQRKKVYDSENAAFLDMFKQEFITLEECKAFVDIVTNSKYWLKHKGYKRFYLKDGRGTRSAWYCHPKREINLPKWSRNKKAIIHELAHALTHKTHGGGVPSHGRFFCTHYIALMQELLGDDEALKLWQQFDDRGVNFDDSIFI